MTGHMVRREGWMKRDSSCKHRLHRGASDVVYVSRTHEIMLLTVATAIDGDFA
jgi:hypothetical protein